MKLKRTILVGLVLIAASLTVGAGVTVAAGDVNITKVGGQNKCRSPFTVYASFSDAGDNFDLYIENVTQGTSELAIYYSYDLSGEYVVSPPAGTDKGDEIEVSIYFYLGFFTLIDSDAYTFHCGNGGSAEPYTGIHLVSDSEQAPYLSVPNAAGQLPCGVFDVNGWGTKYVGLADFPACSPPVTVMCLNGDLEWTADSVSDVVMQGDYEVDFTSSQHGTCALFNQ